MAVRHAVGHLLGGGHPQGATPWLWHSQLVPLRALLRLERMKLRLRLRLRLMLVLMLRLSPGR